MNDLRAVAAEYLAIRRAVGFKLTQTERLLMNFIDFVDAEGGGRVTTELAVRWATLPQHVSPVWWQGRLCVVRCFARYLSAIDPETEVPPLDALPRVGSGNARAVPYIYSDADIAALMVAARSVRSVIPAATCETLVGLLAVTGMRIGEALRLDRDDLDHARGVLVVRDFKFDRSRAIPLHDTTLAALAAYSTLRDDRFSPPRSASFFVSWSGRRLSYRTANEHFRQLTARAGLRPRSARCRPRIHDLRHSFVCATLEDWHRAGLEVEPRLPLLSTYLGHADPSSTYWYVSGKPELLAAAADRLGISLGDLP
jgi:integrase